MPEYTRKKKWAGLVALAAAITLTAAGCASSAPDAGADADPAAGGGTLRYGFIGTLAYPADEIGFGLESGIIQEHLAEIGIDDIETVGLGTGPDINDALNSGALDAATYGDGPGTTAYAAGSPTRLVDFSSVVRESIILAAPDGPTSIDELEGKNVGAVIGSAMHRVLSTYLADEGIQVNWVQGSDTSLLATGAVDALGTWPYNAEIQQLITEDGYPLVFSTADVDDYDWSLISVATDSFVEQYPDFPRVWREARAASVAAIQEDPAAFYQWWADLNGTTVDVAEAVFPIEQISTGSDEEIDAGLAIIDQAQEALLASTAITSGIDAQEWWID